MAFLRLFGCVVALLCWASVEARPEFWDVFTQKYHPAPGSKLAEAACLTCHAVGGPPARNPFGRQVEAALDAAHSKQLTAAILANVESEDANRDGKTNLQAIQAGNLPADPAASPVREEEAIPKHSFHPLVVHFPIALFIFGALLDLWGFRKSRPEARYGANIAISFAALASLIAMPTGLTAFLRLGFSLSGVMLAHFCFAVGSSILMIGIALARRRRPLTSMAYWALLAITATGIAVAGHLGSTVVYG